MANSFDKTIESSLPVVAINGLVTNKAVDFSGSSSVTLPATIVVAASGTLDGAGSGATGFVISDPKNAAAGTLSGTALNVEISIGGVPYYFAVYPTKT